ncbi:MAG: outer membrane protein [Janthinobacterium sp.]|jgi:outer membrane protein
MKSLTSTGAALLLCCASASANDGNQTSLPLWEVGVVGASASTPAYPGSAQRSSRTLALPYFLYRGEVLRADQSGIGARLLNTDAVEFDIGFALSLPARSDEVPARRGMSDLGTLIEFGPRLKFNLGNPSPNSALRLEVPLRAVIEVRSGVRQQGWAFEPRLVFDANDASGAWNLNANLGLVLADASLNNYFYEVKAPFATDDRPAYKARSGLISTRAGVGASRKLGPHWRIFGFARYDDYASSANRDSALFQKNSGVSAGIGFAWTLHRSQARASN